MRVNDATAQLRRQHSIVISLNILSFSQFNGDDNNPLFLVVKLMVYNVALIVVTVILGILLPL